METRPAAPPMLVPFLAAAGAALSLLFIVLPWNDQAFLAINGSNRPWLDPIALTVTMFGDGFVLAMLLLVAGLRSLPRTLAGTTALVFAGVAAQVLKFGANIPRPGAVIPDIHVLGPILLFRSFPSGHSAAAFAVAGVFVLSARSAVGAVVPLAAASAVAWSRIYVGAHFPADAAMGAFIGLSAAGLATAAFQGAETGLDGWAQRHRRLLARGSAVLYAAVGLWLLIRYEALPGEARIPLAVLAAAVLPVFFGVYSRISRR